MPNKYVPKFSDDTLFLFLKQTFATILYDHSSGPIDREAASNIMITVQMDVVMYNHLKYLTSSHCHRLYLHETLASSN